MMHIYFEHNQNSAKSAKPKSEISSDYDIIQSMLKSIDELSLPIEVIDGIITIVKESIVVNAGLVGNAACDILEAISKDNPAFDFIVDKSEDYIRLIDNITYLKYLEGYKHAVVHAGGK